MHLLLRNRTYYFNKRVSGRLLRVSLRVQDRATALIRAARLFDLIRMLEQYGMDITTIQKLALKAANRMHQEWVGRFYSPDYRQGEHDAESEVLRDLIDSNRNDRSTTGLYQYYKTFYYSGLRDRTYQAHHQSPEQGLADIERIIAAETPPPAPLIQTTPTEPARLLSTYVDEYISESRLNNEKLKEQTLLSKKQALDLFIEIVGDKPPGDYQHSDGQLYRDGLKRIPTNRTKKKSYRDLSVQTLINMTDIPESDLLKSKTRSEQLSKVQGFFKWLNETRVTESNPVATIKIQFESESYAQYTADDLTRIFTSRLYDRTNKHYSKEKYQSHWWFLLLALYTGARIGELCQLTKADTKTEEGILMLSINDDEYEGEQKTLKSRAAIRRVPVHSCLLRLGFESYLERLSDNSLLLPNLSKAKRKAGDAASVWFLDAYRRANFPEFKAQRKVFHSFRHTFISTALKAEADLTRLQSMVGHEPALLKATNTYIGEGFSASQLQKEMEKVQFPTLPIDVLEQNSWHHKY